jgi:hypothetical protein
MERVRFVLSLLAAGAFSLGAEEPPPFEPKDKPYRSQQPFSPHGRESDRKGSEGGRERRLDAMAMRRLMELANKPKSELMKELQQWPRFQQMTMEEQGNLMIRLEDMRRKGREEAYWEAQQMGLKLSEQQMDLFAERFWTKKIAMMKKIQEEIEPRRRQLKAEMDQELRKEFEGQ